MRPVRTVRVAHVDIAGVGAAARDHCEWRSTLNLGFAVTARCAQGVTTDAAHAGRFAWSAPGPVELPGRLLARDSSAHCGGQVNTWLPVAKRVLLSKR